MDDTQPQNKPVDVTEKVRFKKFFIHDEEPYLISIFTTNDMPWCHFFQTIYIFFHQSLYSFPFRVHEVNSFRVFTVHLHLRNRINKLNKATNKHSINIFWSFSGRLPMFLPTRSCNIRYQRLQSNLQLFLLFGGKINEVGKQQQQRFLFNKINLKFFSI